MRFSVFGGGGLDTYALQGQAETSQGQVAQEDLEQAVWEAIEEDGGTVTDGEFGDDQGKFALALY